MNSEWTTTGAIRLRVQTASQPRPRPRRNSATGVGHTFEWTAAVKVLAAYLLRCAAWQRRDANGFAPPEFPRLEGGKLSPAASLSFAMSKKNDWILAMCAAGMGFGFIPEFCINHPGVVSRPVTAPEFWREVNIVTVRGRPHSPAVGALIREAMRNSWIGEKATVEAR